MNDLVPTNSEPRLGADLKLGQVFAESGCFPDSRSAAQAFVKVLAGRELGIGPIAAMTGIYIVKGRVTLSANLVAAAIRRSRRYDYRVRQHDDRVCVIDFLMDGQVVGTSSFSLPDAQKAGLAGGDNWKKYPKNMLFARAMTSGARWHCPDVFGGPVYTPDELDPKLTIDAETGEVSPPSQIAAVEVVENDAGPAAAISECEELERLIRRKGVRFSLVLDHYRVQSLRDLAPAVRAEIIAELSARPDVSENPSDAASAGDNFQATSEVI